MSAYNMFQIPLSSVLFVCFLLGAFEIVAPKTMSLLIGILNATLGVVDYHFGHPGKAAVSAALAAWMLFLWWKIGGDDDFRKRRKKLAAKARVAFRAFAPSPIPSPA